MATTEDLFALVPGRRVMITGCEAREHGDNDGCVCKLKGRIVTLAALYDTPWAGTRTWHIAGRSERVRLSEVTFVAPETPQEPAGDLLPAAFSESSGD